MEVDAAIRAIGEPRRREILRLVWSAERSSGEIASQFDITGPAVSQHLKVLREAGLVNERHEGTKHLFSANHQTLRSLPRSAVVDVGREPRRSQGRRRGGSEGKQAP